MKCLRCGKDFETPYPEIVYPELDREIACVEWCPECNALVVNVVHRGSSAYKSRRLVRPNETKVEPRTNT